MVIQIDENRSLNSNQNPNFDGTSNLTEDSASPFFIHHSENHSSVIVSPELTPSNYPSWRRSFLLAVSIRNKQGFLDGTIQKPSIGSSQFQSWQRCNNLLVAWILRSVSSSIASTVFYLEDAKLIWDKLALRFSQPDDSRICQLQNQLCSIIQGTRSIDSYFSDLNTVWEELRLFRPPPYCSCGTCNSGCFQKFNDQYHRDQVYKFLNGLNETFQGLRSQILDPMPNLDQVYNMVIREENQRSLSLSNNPLVIEASAMAVKKEKSKADIKCYHCGQSGHVKAQCYRLIGFPPDFKFTKGKGGNNSVKPQPHQAFQATGYSNGNIFHGNSVSGHENAVTPGGAIFGGDFGGSSGQFPLNLSKEQVCKLMTMLGEPVQTAVSNVATVFRPSTATQFNAAGPLIMDNDWVG